MCWEFLFVLLLVIVIAILTTNENELRFRVVLRVATAPVWEAYPPSRAGDRALAITNFLGNGIRKNVAPGTGALPGRSRPLRRDPVGQRIGMKIHVISQAVPRTIWLSRLRNTVLFTSGKVVPRIVASDT